jgi:hypothetical protein
MKKVLWFIPVMLLTGIIFLGCQDNSITNPVEGSRLYAIGSPNTVGNFNVTLQSVTGSGPYTWIWKIEQINIGGSSYPGLSHFNMKFGLCEDDIVAAFESAGISYDGENFDDFTPTYGPDGKGNACSGIGDILKFDEISGNPVYLKLVLNEQFEVGQITAYTKAGSEDCTSGLIDGPVCGTDEPCYQFETAWGSGARFVTKGNWATYFSTLNSDVTLFAGQIMNAGTVKVESTGGNNFKATYTAAAPWMFTELHFAYGGFVKVGNNPAPGQFPLKRSYDEPVSSDYFEFVYEYTGTPIFAAHAVVVKEVPCQ